MLKQRVITALVLVTLLLAALFALPPIGWSVLVLGVVMLGTAEWGRLSKLSKRGAMAYWLLTLVVMAGIAYGAVTDTAGTPMFRLAIYVPSALLWLVLVPFWLKRGLLVDRPVAMALIGWMVLIPTGLAMMDLRAMSPWLLLGIMALAWMADISAYFTGRKFGKHKLAPGISPGKTWEGVAGALVGVSFYVVLAARYGGLEHGYRNLLILIFASWLWLAFSVIGDLFESAVKRHAGVKDSGALLPGHGGLLDRIDSMTSTLPMAALALLIKGMV